MGLAAMVNTMVAECDRPPRSAERRRWRAASGGATHRALARGVDCGPRTSRLDEATRRLIVENCLHSRHHPCAWYHRTGGFGQVVAGQTSWCVGFAWNQEDKLRFGGPGHRPDPAQKAGGALLGDPHPDELHRRRRPRDRGGCISGPFATRGSGSELPRLPSTKPFARLPGQLDSTW